MSGAKETPRQKMIGMMYLVLTALLALNVSKEILNAFIAIEESLNTTNTNFDTKNGILYSRFKDAYNNDQKKVKPYYDNALKAQKYAKELCDTVDAIKSRLYANVQGGLTKSQADTFQLKYLDSKDNYDIPTRIMIGDDPEHAVGAAVGLKKQIEEFKKKMTELVEQKDRANLKLGLDLNDIYSVAEEKKLTWEDNNFYHSPIAAVFSVLAKLKTDTKNAEGDVVTTLFKAIDAKSFKFDVLEGKVFAPMNYVIAGEKYEADIFVSAHSNTVQPEVQIGTVDSTDRNNPKINSPIIVPVDGGVGKYEITTGAEGLQQYSGIINVKGPDGKMNHYPFHGEYTVAKPSFAVSPTKMNVFYIGVDNPVDISVAGAAPQDVVPSISGGGGTIVNKGQGHYIVNVKTAGDCTVGVSIKNAKTGVVKSMGTPMKFRVKKVPSPTASFAGVVGDGAAGAADLGIAGGVIPKMDAFEFDLQFPVVSWNMSMMVNGQWVDQPATGASVTGAQKLMLQKAKKGGRVIIESVIVKAPDGNRKINGCVIKVK